MLFRSVALARVLAANGHKTLLLAWDGSGDELASASGSAATPGTAQLLDGAMSLEDVIQYLPGTTLEIITAGAATHRTAGPIDGDAAAMVLDALDEMYDFILVCGRSDTTAALFAAVQGRFDAGVLITDGPLAKVQNGTLPFLGFIIPDFPVIAISRSTAPTGLAVQIRPAAVPQRLKAAVRS